MPNPPIISCFPATKVEHFKVINKLAWDILPPVYDPIVPPDQTVFFLETYQSVEAIQKQIQGSYEYYLLQANEVAEGYLGLDFQADSMRISKIYLLPSARGKGLGKLGMEWADKRAKEMNISRIDLMVNRGNTHSIEFYKKQGFQIVESLTTEFKDGFHVLDYRLEKRI